MFEYVFHFSQLGGMVMTKHLFGFIEQNKKEVMSSQTLTIFSKSL